MPSDAPIGGKYIGRPGARPGREDDLSPVERKRFVGAKESYELKVDPSGKFTYNGTIEGIWKCTGKRLLFRPITFQGRTFQDQQRICEEQGRQFRFAFVYDEFELDIHDQRLVEAGTGVIATVYERA
jgi:hypothetical protein